MHRKYLRRVINIASCKISTRADDKMLLLCANFLKRHCEKRLEGNTMLAAEPLGVITFTIGVRNDLLLHRDEIEIRVSVLKLRETSVLLSRSNSSQLRGAEFTLKKLADFSWSSHFLAFYGTRKFIIVLVQRR